MQKAASQASKKAVNICQMRKKKKNPLRAEISQPPPPCKEKALFKSGNIKLRFHLKADIKPYVTYTSLFHSLLNF